MSSRKVLFYLLMLSAIALVIWFGYHIWTGDTSPFLGAFAILVTLFLMITFNSAYQKHSPVDADISLDLTLPPTVTNDVTPEFIAEIISNENVIKVIKNDLIKTGQISYKEVWRLGLITPDQDRYDPNPDTTPRRESTKKFISDPNYRMKWVEQIPLKRSAVLFNTTYFNLQSNNLTVTGGSVKPMIAGYPGWSYGLSTKLNRGEYINIRNIQLDDYYSRASKPRSNYLPEFLKEDGFPLKALYSDGDPLTTDRGGTIVIDGHNVIVIYPRYFVQRRLIDNEGTLVDLGLDEYFGHSALFEVKMRPSVSKLLIRNVSTKGYIPIVRYRSIPYASDFMLSLLDTPMSANGWADIYIDTRGEAKLFIAKEKTDSEWLEMMSRLRQLLFDELARKDYHLLGLTKDKTHMNEYLAKKHSVLADYFIIQEFSFV